MAALVLGPILRYAGEHSATVWVETDAPCTVTVLDTAARTFTVEDHHYALVVITGLAPGTVTPYEVHLDGERRWPESGSALGPSVIRTEGGTQAGALRIAFGSCHVSAPNEVPYTLTKDADSRGHETDALRALARQMAGSDPSTWPHLLLMVGDQVYADILSPAVQQAVDARPATERGGAPATEVADYSEYALLYRDSWGDPVIRWLLSTLPSAMIFDDHDVHDDWNTSAAWVARMRAKPWWHRRIVAAYASYWVYQHLGNLSPDDLERDELWAKVQAADDATELVRASAERAENTTQGTRWSYHRDLGADGRVRLVVVDSRAGRVLDGTRQMVDDDEWRWITETARGDVDHLLIATSLPVLLAPGMQYLEAWNEAVCAGAWGATAARLGERMREAVDLEHWGAFSASFTRMVELVRAVGAGERGAAPSTITMLSGDVHHAYVAEVAFRRTAGVRSRVTQAVCSPLRNPLDARERRVIRLLTSRTAHAVARLVARGAGVRDPEIRWRLCDRPVFDNQIATITLDGRAARLTIDRTTPADGSGAEPSETLSHSIERVLA